MKQIKLTFLFLASFICSMAYGGEVTEQEALLKAQQFMQGKFFIQKNLRRASQNTSMGDALYIFNAEDNGGFVIVSADDRTEAILAYADQGYLDTSTMPENVRKWLEGYAEQIKALGNSEGKSVPRRTDKAAVNPLVTCHWNQRSPYNDLCPIDGENRSVTGCVATAMAQVMYYHQWPKDATATIPSYKTDTKGFDLEDLPATFFKWDIMKDEYDYNETGDAAEAVAELMRYCGQSVEMDYTFSASAAHVSAATMINYFGYSKTAREVCRWNYSTFDWENVIYNEIRNRRPVLYCGNNASSGHEFVIDGYDGNGLFHVNWGWGGSSDGYFLLSVLNPDSRGIGGGSSSDGYSMTQIAIIGLQPDHGEEAALPLIYCNINMADTQLTRMSSDDDFINVPVKASIIQWDINSVYIDHSWALYKNGEPIKVLNVQQNIELNKDYGSEVDAMVSFGAGLADGTYEIRSRVAKPGTEEWENTWSFLVVIISGNAAMLKTGKDIPDAVQVNSVTLEGAKKTGRDMTVLVNLTNNGFDHEIPLYLWIDGDDKVVAGGAAYLDNGQTGDLTLSFKPKTAGNITVRLTTDYEGNNEVWRSESLTIELSLPHTLTGQVAIEGERNYTIEGTTINATFTLKNEGDYAYDDYVIISLIPIDDGGNSDYDGEITEVRNLQLAVGEETRLNTTFPDLIKGQKYFLSIQYYNYRNNSVYEDLATYKYCTVGTVLVAYDMDINMVVKNADSNNNIEGTTIKADIVIKNNGDNDYNDKIWIDLYYKGNDGYFWWEKTQQLNVQVPTGQTVTIEDYEITDLTIGRSYCLIISYESENEPQNKWFWTLYSLIDPTGICDMKKDTTKVIERYTLDGHRIDTYQKGMNIVKMADGTTRKIVVK